MAQMSNAESARVLKEIVQRRYSLERSVACNTQPMMHQMPPRKDMELTGFFYNSHHHGMELMQQPFVGRVVQPCTKGKSAKSPEAGGRQEKPRNNPRNRTLPLDPPAVVRYRCHDNDPKNTWMDSPHIFCTVAIWSCDPQTKEAIAKEDMGILDGSMTASSLQRLPRGNKENPAHWAIFAFPEITVHKPGLYHLEFTLWEMRESAISAIPLFAQKLCSKFTDKPINVEGGSKQLPLGKSTPLTHELSEAGIKVRIRKEPCKRKTQAQDWRASSQKNPTAAALPIGIPNNGIVVTSTNGEDITGRLNYRRRSQDHGVQGTYGHPPYSDHGLMPANGQALIDPGQPLFPFDLGFTLAEIGQGQYLEVQNNAYANPSQYISLPYSDSPSQLNGHAGHQQYSDTHQAQYAGCPVHDSGLSHLNGPDVHQQYFVDTHQPQYKANHPHDMGPSHLNGHAGRQQYLSTTQPQYTSGPVANNDARHRAAQISQQPFTPATNTFSFTAPDSSEKQVAPGEDAWGIDSFDPGTWPTLGPNGMAWPPPRPPHP